MSKAKAFTLLELIVVVAIILIGAGLAAVSLRGFASANRLKETARDFTNLVYLAQERAVSGSRLQRVAVDLDEENFYLEEIAPAAGESYFQKVNLPTFRRSKRKGIDLYQVITPSSDRPIEEDTCYLYFSPEGEVTPVTLIIKNERDVRFKMEIFATGKVKIEKE